MTASAVERGGGGHDASRRSRPACRPQRRPALCRAHDSRAARHDARVPLVAHRGRLPDDPEQPGSRGRREPEGARRLRRHRPRRARLGVVRRDPRGAEGPPRRRVAADPVRQAGRRVPHAPGRAARADRELEPRAALGDVGALQRARPQGPDDVRPDDRGQLDLHRLAGHRAGDLRDVRRGGPPALRRRPCRQVDPHRGLRRHGRRAAARRDDGRCVDASD